MVFQLIINCASEEEKREIEELIRKNRELKLEVKKEEVVEEEVKHKGRGRPRKE